VLKVGDVIVTVDDASIRKPSDIQDAVHAHSGSGPITVSYYRGNSVLPVRVAIQPVFVAATPGG
jgi:S1-C subfamily serine protease